MMSNESSKNTLGASPGALRHPSHSITIGPSGQCWKVSLDGVLLARSDQALRLEESGYQPVIYFPPEDVQQQQLEPSDSETTCPFKGQAHYFKAGIGDRVQDLAWYYPAVYDEVMPIKGYVAFYTERVSLSCEDGPC